MTAPDDITYEVGTERWTCMGVVLTPDNCDLLFAAEEHFEGLPNRKARRSFWAQFKRGKWEPDSETMTAERMTARRRANNIMVPVEAEL